MMETALLLGLGGSLHCAGMCSPLALSVTVFNKHVLINRLLYNGGRIFVYASMGALMASVGSLIDFSAFQNAVSIVLGGLLILMGIGTISSFRIPYFTKTVMHLMGFVKSRFAYFMKRKNFTSLFFMGMLNGLLPCGLTYITLTYTLTLSSAIDGFMFMALFGFGTFPVMVGLPYLLHFTGKYFRVPVSKLTTLLMISIGCLLIGRTLMIHQHVQHPQEIISASDPVICR